MNIIKQLKDANGNKVFPLAYAQGGMKMDLLWTNPNPTASFSATTISMDLSDYDLFLVYTKDYTTTTDVTPTLICKGQITTVLMSVWYNTGREYTFTDSGINIGNGWAYLNLADSTKTYSGVRVIPYKIYGIKMSYIVPTQVHGLQYIEV